MVDERHEAGAERGGDALMGDGDALIGGGDALVGDSDALVENSDTRDPTRVLSRTAAILRQRVAVEPRFIPGTLLLDRYRIAGLLGRGGMGEIYRADDLKLREPVALKFLPEDLAKDEAMLARFHHEVRISHQISHPNVCRVYDIIEVEGQHFISMEYIDGEDLAALLRRIGHLSRLKALQIAHQLCAGLAAAHAGGVLHRDLKPANVMIDGRGKAKITDFGLAGLADEFHGRDAQAGTPAYMAPEQLLDKNVSVKSDLYSLGLVLFELFTGHKAFLGSDREDRLRRGQEALPRRPTELVDGIDPAVEQALLSCLCHDPAGRPASALELSQMLPGGSDPLAAALAAGETPSPEMVAAAPREGSLDPRRASTALAFLVLALLAATWLSNAVTLYRRAPLEKTPEVLAERAREWAAATGWTAADARPADEAGAFREHSAMLCGLAGGDLSPDQLESGRAAALYYWHRTSPEPMVPLVRGFWRVDYDDPPFATPGMTRMALDPRGRLIAFQAVPSREPDAAAVNDRTDGGGGGETVPVDWSPLFTAAGLTEEAFRPTAPARWPPVISDQRRAWEGEAPEHAGARLRVEAAALAGRPVYFEVVTPWTESPPWHRPGRSSLDAAQTGWSAVWILLILLFFTVLLGGAGLAWRNLENGRGDRRGAFRLVAFFFVLSMVSWLFWASHVASFLELTLFIEATALALFRAAMLWLLYIALEPYVRRRWPSSLISWSRLLAGRFGDPLVGRDLLAGSLFGVATLLLIYLGSAAPMIFGRPALVLDFLDTDALAGLPGVIRQINEYLYIGTLFGASSLFFLLLLALALGRESLATGAFWLLTTLALNVAHAGGPELRIALAVVAALWIWVLKRFGLLAVASGLFFYFALRYFPVTTDFGAWYAESAMWALFLVLGPAVYGFYTSLAGRPILRRGFFEERATRL